MPTVAYRRHQSAEDSTISKTEEEEGRRRGLNKRTCATQAMHTCRRGGGRSPSAISSEECVRTTQGRRLSFRRDVGVCKVCIDRLLAWVTCAFLGTLDPGHTHGN